MIINPETLNFSDYLKQQPSEYIITAFLNEEDGWIRRIVSSSMIEEIADKFSTKEEIKKRFFSLSSDQQIKCGWMYLMGKMGVSTICPKAPLTDPLVSSFLGYAAKRDEEIRIFGFSSFRKNLEYEIVHILVENLSEKVALHSTLKYDMATINDIVIVLSFISRKLFTKRKNGKIVANVFPCLKKLLHVPHFYEICDIEIIVKAIVEYCKSKGLVKELDDRYVSNSSAIYSWLKRTPQENMAEVKEFFVKEIIGWDIELVLKICENSGDKWLKAFYPSLEDEKYVRKGLLLLDLINIIEIKKHKGEIFFRKSMLRKVAGMEDTTRFIIMMPDFSLLIREECPSEELYIFSCFSKLTVLDQIYHGKIEKESFTNALADCCETEIIIPLLNKYNVPSNVILSVKEWIREFLRISLCKNGTLIIADPKTGEQIAFCEELKPFIKEIPIKTAFVIKKGAEEEIERILKEMGFDIRMPVINYWEEKSFLSYLDNSESPDKETGWSLIIDNKETKENKMAVIRGSKYSSELKKLELSETIQVIDYAILTSQKLILSYQGSNYIKKGIYNVVPLKCIKTAEPLLEGEVERTGSRKKFYISKIDSIGVI